ncbi:hypothetical protein [Qipengyuania spongiae]|nr:hypothetical protein [Qipengyuania spongiae]
MITVTSPPPESRELPSLETRPFGVSMVCDQIAAISAINMYVLT